MLLPADFVYRLADGAQDVKFVEDDLLLRPRHARSRGGDVRVPHVHGHSSHLRQLLGRELVVVRLQTLLTTLLHHVLDRAALGVTDHRLVAMAFGKRLFIHAQVGRDAPLLPGPASGHGLLHRAPRFVPTGPRQSCRSRHVALSQGINQPAFHLQAELRSRTRPTGLNLTDPMLPALYPRQAGVQIRAALAGIQVPPLAFLGMVVHRRRLPTLRTTPPRSGRLLDPHVDPLGGDLQSHFSHHP